MNFEDDEEWDLELVDKLVQTEEQAIAARRSASQPAPLPLPPPSPLSLSLRKAPAHPRPAQHDPPPLVLDLQQRLLQAQQELGELRHKVLHPMVIATPTLQQELCRLQSEILFKDQEILEARRACVEKSERLKRAIVEIEELRKGSEDGKRVKWQTSTGTKNKEEERGENAPTIRKANLTNIPDSEGPSNLEIWCPPWTSSVRTGSLHGVSKSKSSSPQAIKSAEDPACIKELKNRVLDNGCSSSSEKDLEQGEIAKISSNGGNIQSKKGTLREGEAEKKDWEHLFLSTALNLWCPRNVKEEGEGLLSKVLALCEADLQILLSMDIGEASCSQHLQKNRILCETSPLISKRNFFNSLGGGLEGWSASFGTHSLLSVLSKVASGLLSSWGLFMAVLELSQTDNIQVSESALRVLHCILMHDEGCQSRVFARNCFRPPQSQQEFQISAGANWFYKGAVESDVSFNTFEASMYAESTTHKYFFSPRISWQEKMIPYFQTNLQDSISHETNSRYMASGDCNQGALSDRIFKCILCKAVSGSSEGIKITAMSILVTLAMNAEPIHERERFGFILFDGSMASLLGVSVGLGLRLQAVRLIHSLLHCPSVLKKLLDMQDQALESLILKESGVKSGSMQDLELDARNFEENGVLQNSKEMSAQSETAGDALEKCSFEVLEGLISCLLHGDRSSQAYSLRRNALRVLTFVATSGQKGAAFLLAKETALNKADGMRKESDGIQNSNSIAVSSGCLPMHLIVLLDQELKRDGDKLSVLTSAQIEEREYVIREALTLLCRFASHSTQSASTLAAITHDKDVARLSISVMNRLMSSVHFSEMSRSQLRSINSPVDMIELCRGLRRRILANISTL